MKSLILFLTLCTFICCTYCFTTLPSYMKLCSRSDPKLNECLLKYGNEALPYVIKGDPMYHIPSFNPLKLDKVNLEASENVKLYGTNISVVGLHLMTLKDINWDIDNKELKLKMYTPLLRILGTYNINGHILVLTLKGSGAMNNSHYDNNIEVGVTYTLPKKNGLEYFKIDKFEIEFVMKSVHFYFDNFLNNPTLSKQINNMLNENAKVLLVELLISIKKIVKDVMLAILDPILEKVPFDNIIKP